MFFYYNNEAKENLSGYIKEIEKSFRYGFESPLKNKLENQDIVEIIVLPMQEKREKVRVEDILLYMQEQ